MIPSAEPRYFGPSNRPLFGWLHRGPGNGPSRSTGLIICNPFGYEALCSHRSLRHFAEAAAALGYPTLRFDYDGTGDSAGSELDPERWASWLRSIDDAITELRHVAGVSSVCLLGFRLGATAAALVAERRGDIAGLAAIAPVLAGRPWLRELRALRGAMGRAPAPPEFALPDGVLESVGLMLPAETQTAIHAVDLTSMSRSPADLILLLDRDDRPTSTAWASQLKSLGADVNHRVVPGVVEMMLDPHEARVPEAIIATFIGWLTARFPACSEARGAVQAAQGPVLVAPAVEEQACFLDESRTLFGVVSSPAGRRPTRALLLLNSGATPHTGTGRMYVKFARRLAVLGWLVLRYDVSGIGDSAAHEGRPENEVYTDRAVGDLSTALHFLRSRFGVERTEAAGLCSGAYFAFKGAVAGLPLQRVTVVNPLVFFWKDGMSLAYPAYEMVQSAAQYQRSVLEPAKWLKLARGGVNLPTVARVISHRLADRGAGLVRNLRRSLRIPAGEDLGLELEGIAARGTAIRFVFSTGDPGEALLSVGAGWVLPRLERRRRLDIAHLPNCDHSLSASWMHELLWREFLRGLERA